MVSEKKISNVKFEKLVDRLYQSKRLSLSQADLLQSVCFIHQEKFSSFDYKSDQVVQFLGQFIEKDKRLSDLWTVCVFVFVLAQGQSQTEDGFNINKAMLVENLKETSIKGQLLYTIRKFHYSQIYYSQRT